MKKSTIIIFLVLSILKTQAQDYLISFLGTGGSNTVDSVQVKNLTQNTILSMSGTDILHLRYNVGIDPAYGHTGSFMRIYPNPMRENGFIEFEATSSGISVIELFDVEGKKVAKTQIMLPCDKHTFAVTGLTSGIYTLKVKSAGYFYSGKIVCTSFGQNSGKISYIYTNLKQAAKGKLKSSQSEIQMHYNEGDQLLFKCFSGIYSSVIPIVPKQSQTVTANFVDCTDTDGNHYATITIGAQLWMAENINVGVRIFGSQNQTNNGITEKWCYDDNDSNCAIYGGLYKWNEMMQYVTAEGAQGICPTGWHLPTNNEWITITDFLGGLSVAGGKMKSTGTREDNNGLWYYPNTGATNESGFTMVPSGWRNNYNGVFSGIDYHGFFWSSTETVVNYGFIREMLYSSSEVTYTYHEKYDGLSVRCVKN